MTTRAKRILLAEDEAALCDFVSRNLRARGFEVFEASNGLEALALWEREDPHLLILDIMMPRMDGLEVCRRVREHSAVPIIVLTALDAESDKVTALDLGADDYLTKPFGVEEPPLKLTSRGMLCDFEGPKCVCRQRSSPFSSNSSPTRARCSLIVCCYRVSGGPNTAARPSTCACILTVCARSWSLILPAHATYSPSRVSGTALSRPTARQHADALLLRPAATEVCVSSPQSPLSARLPD